MAKKKKIVTNVLYTTNSDWPGFLFLVACHGSSAIVLCWVPFHEHCQNKYFRVADPDSFLSFDRILSSEVKESHKQCYRKTCVLSSVL